MNNYGILVFLWENSSFLWERGVANGKSLNDTSYGTKLALTDACLDKPLQRTASWVHSSNCRWVPPLPTNEAFRSPTKMLTVEGWARKACNLHLIRFWRWVSGEPCLRLRAIHAVTLDHSVSISESRLGMGQYVLITWTWRWDVAENVSPAASPKPESSAHEDVHLRPQRGWTKMSCPPTLLLCRKLSESGWGASIDAFAILPVPMWASARFFRNLACAIVRRTSWRQRMSTL